ncbi:hypothetical protein ACG92U_02410 [Leuconostoc citreum]
MVNYQITFRVDGQVVTEEDVRAVELQRYHHVFKIFDAKAIPITLDNQILDLESLLQLPLENAKVALAETREKLANKNANLISI